MEGQPGIGFPQKRVFGPFTFDELSGELRKQRVRLRLEGQALQILIVLLRQPGTVVTRVQLQQQLWKDGTFVDYEHGLNTAMSRLRQVLCDSAENPRYVETLPGRGYRFIAEVCDSDQKPALVVSPPGFEAEEVSANQLPAAPSLRRKGRVLWPLATGIVTACLMAGFFLVPGSEQSSGAKRPPLHVLPPDGYALEAGSSRQVLALSPDGSKIAFTAMDSAGIFHTFIRRLDSAESVSLPGSEGSYSVFWAPDGRSVFLTRGDKLVRSTLQKDSYQVVCQTPALTFMGALLGPNLLISTRTSNFLVPESGGTPQIAKELYPWPQVLPDGKHLLYTRFDSKSGHHRASVVRLGEPQTTTEVLETDSRTMYAPSILKNGSGYLLSVRAGTLLAHAFDPTTLRVSGQPLAIVPRISSHITGAADFSVSQNGTIAYKRYVSRSQLAWVARSGEVIRTIGPANVNLKQARLSPDGRKIATPVFDVQQGVNQMWIIDAQTGSSRRAIVGRGTVDNPVWAPDSSRLAYSRAYDTPPKLFIRSLGEMNADISISEGYFQTPTDWSPDGRYIAFGNTTFSQVNNELKGDVWLVDMARRQKIVHLIRTPFHEANPAFSPDGRWLAFTSDESGRTELYVQAFKSGEEPLLVGERLLVSRHGAICLRWSRDGRELFYLGRDGRLFSVLIALSPELKLGTPTALFTISTEARSALHSSVGFDVSPDRQHFLVPFVTSPERSDIVVLSKWEATMDSAR